MIDAIVNAVVRAAMHPDVLSEFLALVSLFCLAIIGVVGCLLERLFRFALARFPRLQLLVPRELQ